MAEYREKRSDYTFPFLKEKVEWGMVPYVQAAMLLAQVFERRPRWISGLFVEMRC